MIGPDEPFGFPPISENAMREVVSPAIADLLPTPPPTKDTPKPDGRQA